MQRRFLQKRKIERNENRKYLKEDYIDFTEIFNRQKAQDATLHTYTYDRVNI